MENDDKTFLLLERDEYTLLLFENDGKTLLLLENDDKSYSRCTVTNILQVLQFQSKMQCRIS